MARHVDDGVDLGGAKRSGVKEVVDRAVFGEIQSRIGHSRSAAREVGVELAWRGAAAERENDFDVRVVVEILDHPAPDRLVGVGDEYFGHWRFRSISSWTARRTWLAR